MVEMTRDLGYLHPTLRKLAEQLITECHAQGIKIIVTETFRTEARQSDLYAQGRSGPRKSWKRVTNAKFPQSLHCWGLAFDIAYVDKTGKVNWTDLAMYTRIGHIGQKIGLEWGGSWVHLKDNPHYQLPGFSWSAMSRRYGNPVKFLRMCGVEVPH